MISHPQELDSTDLVDIGWPVKQEFQLSDASAGFFLQARVSDMRPDGHLVLQLGNGKRPQFLYTSLHHRTLTNH